jgi:hypothetical protein
MIWGSGERVKAFNFRKFGIVAEKKKQELTQSAQRPRVRREKKEKAAIVLGYCGSRKIEEKI